MKGEIKDLSLEIGGGLNILLSVPRLHLEEINGLKGQPVEVDIKKYREKRSLSANAYAWALITKIAQSMTPPLNKEDVYVEMLKRYGQGGIVTIQKSTADEVLRAFDYYEHKGEGTANGKAFVHVMVYIGSSKYNTKEMSIFINGIVTEADDMGIETMTPQELAMLEGVRG